MKRLTLCLTMVAAISAAGCLFVDDADQVWQDGSVDKDLIGTWSGSNSFQSLTFTEANGHLLLSAKGMPQDPSVILATNLRVRTTNALGCNALIIKDIWASVHEFGDDEEPTTNTLPAHLMKGYLITPYRIEGKTLTLQMSDNLKLKALIEDRTLRGFNPEPPPARDFTPPILERLDTNTITILKTLISDKTLFTEQHNYTRANKAMDGD